MVVSEGNPFHMNDFAKRLRERAATLRLSNAELARRTGLSDQRLGNYIAGTREPDLATLSRLASALQTSPDWLLGFDVALGADAARTELESRAYRAISQMSVKYLELVVPLLEAASGNAVDTA